MPECEHCGLFLVSPIARRTHKKSCTARQKPDLPIKKWLTSRGLAQYTHKFVDKEYVDVAVIEEMGIDDDDLDYLEITDQQHRAALKVEHAPAPTDIPTAAGIDDIEHMRQRVAELEAKLLTKDESESLRNRMAALEAQLQAKAKGEDEIDRLEKQLAAREQTATRQAAEISQLEALAAGRSKKEEAEAEEEVRGEGELECDCEGQKKITSLDQLTNEQRGQLVRQLAATIPDPTPDEGTVRLYDLPVPGEPGCVQDEQGRYVWRETDEQKAKADQRNKELLAHAALMNVERKMREAERDKVKPPRVPKAALSQQQQQRLNEQIDDLDRQLAAVANKLDRAVGSRLAMRERGVLHNQRVGLDEQRTVVLKELYGYDSGDDESIERFYKCVASRTPILNDPLLAAGGPESEAQSGSGPHGRKVWRGAPEAQDEEEGEEETNRKVLNKLPAGWEQRHDPETGRAYYVDHSTQTTHWDHPLVEHDVPKAPADPKERQEQDRIFDRALEKARRDKEAGRQMFHSSSKLERYHRGSQVMDNAFIRKVEGAIQSWEAGLFGLEDFYNDWNEARRQEADEVRAACGGNLVLAYMRYHQVASTTHLNGPQADHLQAALSSIDEVLQYTPKHSKSLYRRAQVYQAMKCYREAEADLQLAKTLSPNSQEIRAKLKEVKKQIEGRLQAQRCHEETKRMEIRRRKDEMKSVQRAKDVHAQCMDEVDYATCMLLHDEKYLLDVDGSPTDWIVPKSNGGRGSDYYFWGQTLSGVEVYAKVGLDEMGKNVDVKITTNNIVLTVIEKTGKARQVLGGKLHEPVLPEHSFWEIDRPGIVYIYLKKLYPTHVATGQTMQEALDAGLTEPEQPERKWWNKMIHGDLQVNTDRMRANATDFAPDDARRSARRVHRVVAEGKTIDQDAREQAVVGKAKTDAIEAETKWKQKAKQKAAEPEMTEQERKHKEEQDQMYKTMERYNGGSNPRDRVIWDSSDEEEALEHMYAHVPDPEQRRHLNTIQKNFSARMRKNKRAEDVIDAELRLEEIEMEKRLAEEKKTWMK